MKLGDFLSHTHIAYLSMEIALRPEIHTYAGGLGILAGDTVRSCADLDMPLVFVTLVSHSGYFRQTVEHGQQVEHADPWDPAQWAQPLPAMVGVAIEGRDVWIRPWLYVHTGTRGHSVPVLFLDTDVDQNDPRDRDLTHYLYGGDTAYRLKQELVLGVGGARTLQALGFRISTYHLNEGHAAFLPVELLRRPRRPGRRHRDGSVAYDPGPARRRCVFTTHTPVEAGHDSFSYDLVAPLVGDTLPLEELKRFGGEDRLNMSRLALNLSGYVNGVTRRHATTARDMFPGYDVQAITNGVHAETWTHPAFAALYESNYPQWAHDPEVLVRADHLGDEDIWSAHSRAKTELCRMVAETTGVDFREDVAVIGFARRMTGYKRPDLLLFDLARLSEIAERHPFQAVFAGKAHPRDGHGKEAIAAIHAAMNSLAGRVRFAYVPNYDMTVAKTLVSGPDIWLNTPLPPLEASGTSGMKAALNGVLNLSTLDGWWIEAWMEGATGWTIDPSVGKGDADALYAKLDEVVLPLYYRDRARWIWMMKQAISKIAPYFNSHRMMRRYAAEAYIR